MKEPNKLPNRIEEFFSDKETSLSSVSTKQLFSAEREDVELKTELLIEEISLIERLYVLDNILVKNGCKPLYDDLMNKRMRLKISLDRKSRGEFVNINKQGGELDEEINKMGALSNILGSRK